MELKYYAGKDVLDALLDCMERISKQDGADVAEVVRCKDCKHSYDSVGGWCCSHGVCVDCVVPEDFYCAYGQRKEDEG